MSQDFDNAYGMLREADEKLRAALSLPEGELRAARLRVAFYATYQAVLVANMLLEASAAETLDTDGGVFTWAKSELDDFTRIVYARYYRDGVYSGCDPEREFSLWFDRARNYVDLLAAEAKRVSIARPAVEWAEQQRKDGIEGCQGLGAFPR